MSSGRPGEGDRAVAIPPQGGTGAALVEEAQRFIEEQRVRCLWFLRQDYRPTTSEQLLRALRYIERYGDREAYVKARQFKLWLSQLSNETSVG